MPSSVKTVSQFVLRIIYSEDRKFKVDVSDNLRTLIDGTAEGSLIYFEKFPEKSKALNKKRYVEKLSKDRLLKLIKKKIRIF